MHLQWLIRTILTSSSSLRYPWLWLRSSHSGEGTSLFWKTTENKMISKPSVRSVLFKPLPVSFLSFVTKQSFFVKPPVLVVFLHHHFYLFFYLKEDLTKNLLHENYTHRSLSWFQIKLKLSALKTYHNLRNSLNHFWSTYTWSTCSYVTWLPAQIWRQHWSKRTARRMINCSKHKDQQQRRG